jgi:predicted alpha/beta hydrolase family esterase
MKKPTILFIQGGGKGAYEIDQKLASFLHDALGETYDINYPTMPNEYDPDYDLWKIKFDQELNKIEGKVVLVGHSVGGFLLLKYLSKNKIDTNITGMFFIAIPFVGKGGWKFEDMALDKDFATKLPSGAPVFFYHCNNDEIVPFSHLALYAKELPLATIRKIAGRGHQLNNDLSEVVQDIKNLR